MRVFFSQRQRLKGGLLGSLDLLRGISIGCNTVDFAPISRFFSANRTTIHLKKPQNRSQNHGFSLRRLSLAISLLFGLSLSGAVQAEGIYFLKAYTKKADALPALDGTYSVTVSADGKHVYSAGYQANALQVFARNASNGELTPLQSVQNGADGVAGMSNPYAIVVSPDGKQAYVAGYGDDAVVVFQRAADGKLTFSQLLQNGQGAGGLDGVESLVISPDGRHLYAASFTDNAIAVFSRDGGSGQLSFINFMKDGLPSLQGASAVTISQDGKNVYATGFKANGLSVFSRDEKTGKLTFIEMFKERLNNVEGLHGANAVLVSPDGQHVYVAGFKGKEIAIFKRKGDGSLQYVTKLEDRVLNGVKALAISPDGSLLFAASRKSDALISFKRAADGSLSLFDTKKNKLAGVSGLRGAYSVTVTPDGKHIYVGSFFADAVALFYR